MEGARKMTQGLRAPAALAGDPASFTAPTSGFSQAPDSMQPLNF